MRLRRVLPAATILVASALLGWRTPSPMPRHGVVRDPGLRDARQRAIYHGGWVACTTPPLLPWDSRFSVPEPDVGEDTGTPVNLTYDVPFRLSGTIRKCHDRPQVTPGFKHPAHRSISSCRYFPFDPAEARQCSLTRSHKS